MIPGFARAEAAYEAREDAPQECEDPDCGCSEPPTPEDEQP